MQQVLEIARAPERGTTALTEPKIGEKMTRICDRHGGGAVQPGLSSAAISTTDVGRLVPGEDEAEECKWAFMERKQQQEERSQEAARLAAEVDD